MKYCDYYQVVLAAAAGMLPQVRCARKRARSQGRREPTLRAACATLRQRSLASHCSLAYATRAPRYAYDERVPDATRPSAATNGEMLAQERCKVKARFVAGSVRAPSAQINAILLTSCSMCASGVLAAPVARALLCAHFCASAKTVLRVALRAYRCRAQCVSRALGANRAGALVAACAPCPRTPGGAGRRLLTPRRRGRSTPKPKR